MGPDFLEENIKIQSYRFPCIVKLRKGPWLVKDFEGRRSDIVKETQKLLDSSPGTCQSFGDPLKLRGKKEVSVPPNKPTSGPLGCPAPLAGQGHSGLNLFG